MKTVTVDQAKAHLSELIAEVASGGEVTTVRGKVPLARLVPAETRARPW